DLVTKIAPPAAGVPARAGRVLYSSRCHDSPECLPEFPQSGTDSGLDGAEWLIQPGRDLLMCQLGEEGGLDRQSFVRRQNRQRLAQEPALLPEHHHVVRV